MTDDNLDVIVRLAEAAHVKLWSGIRERADCVNPGWDAYTGRSARDWREVVHGDDLDRCTRAWRAAVIDGSAAHAEVRLRANDGTYGWHHVEFVATTTGRWFAVARGIARTAVLADNFLAAVAHELRAPIASVLMWEQLLRRGLDEGTRERALDAIHHSARLQARLVDDLLEVTRAKTGKLAVRRDPVEIARVIECALDAMQPLASAKDQTLEARVEPDLGRVDGDEARLVQVVENLLGNAIKFTPRGGHIELAAFIDDADVVIDVVDDGRGIAQEFLPYVFDAFAQSGDDAGGLGLGLAISAELVALHHGTIDVWSAGLGRGARFRVRLPTTDQVALRHDIANVAILVVDADLRELAALERVLARAGANVQCASTLAAASAALDYGMPDLVMIGLPEDDAVALLRQVRSARLPVLALTAHADDVDRAIADGFDGHLARPLEIDVLVASIARLVRRHSRGPVQSEAP